MTTSRQLFHFGAMLGLALAISCGGTRPGSPSAALPSGSSNATTEERVAAVIEGSIVMFDRSYDYATCISACQRAASVAGLCELVTNAVAGRRRHGRKKANTGKAIARAAVRVACSYVAREGCRTACN